MATAHRFYQLRRPCVTVLGKVSRQQNLHFAPRRLLTKRQFTSLARCSAWCTKQENPDSWRSESHRFHNMSSAKMTSAAGAADSISFQDFDVFGFDLDHTIAKYKLVALFDTVYDCVVNFLVNERGYDKSIGDDLHKYKDFICKGLFLDVANGNILKLGHDGTIQRATHGTRQLSKAEIQQEYGEDMKWNQMDSIRGTLRNGSPAYWFFENYFDCPGLVATARIIDSVNEKHKAMPVTEKKELYAKAWKDVLDSLHHMYSPQNFAAEKGGYFSTVKKEPSKYVEECSKEIKQWLKSLRQTDKIVFLLTSSQIDYAACLLEVCLGKEWESYFDISLFHGRKPAFFTDNNPFYALEEDKETDVVTELKRNGCYGQGNIDQFNKYLAKELGKEDFKVLYFGDNICSDAYPSKHFGKWSTVLILEEMDAEGYLCSDGTVPGHEDDMKNHLSGSVAKKRKILEHSSLVTEGEIDYLLTDFWGPLLVHHNDGSSKPTELNTFWGDVVKSYSDIVVPSLEYLAGVPLDHRYRTCQANGKGLGGFHPGRPSSLLP